MSGQIQNFARIWEGIEAARTNKAADMLGKMAYDFAQLRLPPDFALARSTISQCLVGLTNPPRSLLLITYIFRIWKSYETFPLYLVGVLCKAVFIGTQALEWYEIELEKVRQIIHGITKPRTEIVESPPPTTNRIMSKAISIGSSELKTGFYWLPLHGYKVWCAVVCAPDSPPEIYISYVWTRLLSMENPHVNGADMLTMSLMSLKPKGLDPDPRLSCSGGLRIVLWEEALNYIKESHSERPFSKKRLDRLVEKSKVKNLLMGSQFPQLLMDIPAYLRESSIREEAANETDDEVESSTPPRKRKREVEKKSSESAEPPRKVQKIVPPEPGLQAELLGQIKNYGEMLREIMKKI